jgi:hypothetical protein
MNYYLIDLNSNVFVSE